MNVLLDGQPLVVEPGTMASAMRAGVEAAGARGRVIVEVYVDGSPATEAMLEAPPESEVGREVRLVSVEPRSLVRVTLLDAVDALEHARGLQSRSAELIQSGKVEEALRPLSEVIRTWQVVPDAVEKGAAMMEIPLDRFGGGMAGLIESLAGHLTEVRRCLAGEDWSALADALAYDMAEQADRWKAALSAAAEDLRPG